MRITRLEEVHIKEAKKKNLHLNSSVVLMLVTWFSAIQEVSLVYLSLKRTQCALQFNYRTH